MSTMMTLLVLRHSELTLYILCMLYLVLHEHKRYCKKLLCSIKSDRMCHKQFITLELTCDPKISLLCKKLMSLWGKHQAVPDMLSSSSSCCLSITFDRVTKNTNYLQEKRGLSCQKGSHKNRYSSISSCLCCECIFF